VIKQYFRKMGRAVAAAIAFAMSAAAGVIAAFITTRATWGLWVSLVGIVILGALLQGFVTVHERASAVRVAASGPAAVAVGGSATKVQTLASDANGTRGTSEGAEVSASGPGSVSVGGDAGEITTRVTHSKDS